MTQPNIKKALTLCYRRVATSGYDPNVTQNFSATILHRYTISAFMFNYTGLSVSIGADNSQIALVIIQPIFNSYFWRLIIIQFRGCHFFDKLCTKDIFDVDTSIILEVIVDTPLLKNHSSSQCFVADLSQWLCYWTRLICAYSLVYPSIHPSIHHVYFRQTSIDP